MPNATTELEVQASPHTKEGVTPTQQNVSQILVSDAIKNVFGVEAGNVVPPTSQSPVVKEHGMEHPDSEQPLADVFKNLTVLTVGERTGESPSSEFTNLWKNRSENLSETGAKEWKK